MDFEMTSEQEMLRDTVRSFLDKEIAPLDREYGDKEMTPELAKTLLKKLIPFGYLGVDAARDQLDRAILEEELGRVSPSLAGVQFIANAAANGVAGSAHPELKERLAGPLLAGDLIGCAAFSEPNVGSDPTAIECKAVRKGDRFVISGTKTWISNGHIADVALVMLRIVEEDGSERLGQILVDRAETPFESRDIPTLGLRAFPLSELHFDELEVPAINLMGGWTERPASSSGRNVPDFNGARVLCASVSTGIAQAALEIAVDYVKVRKQFGKEIGRFQLVQGLLADMAMQLDAARLLTLRARQLLMKRRCDAEVSMAKAYATEAAVEVTSKAMECLGAIGLTQEAHIERLYRDARMWIVPDGTAQIQRLVIGRSLTGFSALR